MVVACVEVWVFVSSIAGAVEFVRSGCGCGVRALGQVGGCVITQYILRSMLADYAVLPALVPISW